MACVDSTRKMREKLPVNRTAKNERDIITKNLWRPTKAARGFCGGSLGLPEFFFGESMTNSRFGKDIAHARIYFCLLLLGLSGIVRFSLPLSIRGKRILRLK